MAPKKMQAIKIDDNPLEYIDNIDYPIFPQIVENIELIKSPPSQPRSNYIQETLDVYMKFLDGEIAKRKKIRKRNIFISSVCYFLEFLFIILDIFVGIYGYIYPQSAAITSQICISFTSIVGFLRLAVTKIFKVNDIHLALLVLAEMRRNSIRSKWMFALQDKEITPEEYEYIVNDFKLYKMSVEELKKNGNISHSFNEKFETSKV